MPERAQKEGQRVPGDTERARESYKVPGKCKRVPVRAQRAKESQKSRVKIPQNGP